MHETVWKENASCERTICIIIAWFQAQHWINMFLIDKSENTSKKFPLNYKWSNKSGHDYAETKKIFFIIYFFIVSTWWNLFIIQTQQQTAVIALFTMITIHSCYICIAWKFTLHLLKWHTTVARSDDLVQDKNTAGLQSTLIPWVVSIAIKTLYGSLCLSIAFGNIINEITHS
jgi:hypothetical protein